MASAVQPSCPEGAVVPDGSDVVAVLVGVGRAVLAGAVPAVVRVPAVVATELAGADFEAPDGGDGAPRTAGRASGDGPTVRPDAGGVALGDGVGDVPSTVVPENTRGSTIAPAATISPAATSGTCLARRRVSGTVGGGVTSSGSRSICWTLSALGR